MAIVRLALQDLIDELEVAQHESALRSCGERAAKRLGFTWFAYLASAAPQATIISSYPKAWVRYYSEQHFDQVDPVVRPSQWPRQAFFWSGDERRWHAAEERRLFNEARSYRIRCGVTVPIRGGGNRFAAFTFAADEYRDDFRRYACEAMDILQLIGLYYHTHVDAKLRLGLGGARDARLTHRETQCLTWAARGKTMAETAQILGITKRTVEFHLDNARAKLEAVTVSQAVAEAIRREFLPRN